MRLVRRRRRRAATVAAAGRWAWGRRGAGAAARRARSHGASVVRRFRPALPLRCRSGSAGCLGWLHCTTPTPADLRLFFVREEMVGDAAEMAGDAAEATAAPQEAATTAAAAAAASSSAAVAAFVRRGGCRELAAAARCTRRATPPSNSPWRPPWRPAPRQAEAAGTSAPQLLTRLPWCGTRAASILPWLRWQVRTASRRGNGGASAGGGDRSQLARRCRAGPRTS